jgi:hypothetical protein
MNRNRIAIMRQAMAFAQLQGNSARDRLRRYRVAACRDRASIAVRKGGGEQEVFRTAVLLDKQERKIDALGQQLMQLQTTVHHLVQTLQGEDRADAA